MEEESRRLQFKFLITKKNGPHPKLIGQPNQQDTNRLYHTISVIMVSGFGKMTITKFKVIQSIDVLVVN